MTWRVLGNWDGHLQHLELTLLGAGACGVVAGVFNDEAAQAARLQAGIANLPPFFWLLGAAAFVGLF